MSKEKKTRQFFEIRRIYIKDLSFESPNTPTIFYEKWNPSINFDLNTVSNCIDTNIFENVLQVRVVVKNDKRLVFLCDIHQAGIFFIKNFDDKTLKHCLGAYCPNILFPYARACISNLVSHASFPQLNLAPINFDSIYYKSIHSEKDDITKE